MNKILNHLLITGLFLLLPIISLASEEPPQFISEQNISQESDAIAVRVLPNPNHYSAARWYQSQGFTGSPQSLLVDGYDAVRDGRTVYVNAANVDLANNIIYTNIYLISYNQSSHVGTVDVLGQIIKNWRFNSNLNTVGECSISTLLCERDSDCSENYFCSNLGEDFPGRCQALGQNNCYTDNDCSPGIYCDSLKAKVTRDVRRLGILGDLREALSYFKQANNRFPVLSSGSYIPLHSISVWPSWQSVFLAQIGSSQPAIDPINSLGPCPGHSPDTCWNEFASSFFDPNPNNEIFELPANSYAFTYASDSNGSNYSLCASMETKELGYNTAEGHLAELGCVESGTGYVGFTDNEPPVLISANLRGEQDQTFSGFIRVIDPDNNPLTWSINTSGIDWTGWSAPPILQDTSNPNQKRIYAQKAGNVGVYNLFLNVSDPYGGTLATITPISIVNNPPLIQADDINYYPNLNLPLIIRFSVSDKHHPLSYLLSQASYSSNPHDLLSSANATLLEETSNRIGDTINYTLKYNLKTSPSNKFQVDTNFVYQIEAFDSYSESSTRRFNINIKADPPALDFNCAKNVRVGSDYYCGLGWGVQGDHTISYSSVGPLPNGLVISEASNISEPGIGDDERTSRGRQEKINSFLSRISSFFITSANALQIRPFYALVGKPTLFDSNVDIRIRAENEFGAVSEREFSLNINNYCGDGIKQEPNMEGKGGFYNDGHEDCDGVAGIASSVQESRVNKQYGCTTKPNSSTPYPIPNNQYFCTFTEANDPNGGGFCGDGICQAYIKINGNPTPWENANNCPVDCADDDDAGRGGDDPEDDAGRGGDDPEDDPEDDTGRGGDDCGELYYEGKTYQTTMIGDQCWMAENLNLGTRINANANQNYNVSVQKYCYNNLESNCDIYGALYQWNTIRRGEMLGDPQGICPDGWHIPRDFEWHALESYLANASCDANRFGADCSPAGETLKNSEFAVLLSGYHDRNLGFSSQGSVEKFWASTHRLSPHEGVDTSGMYPFIREFDTSSSIVRQAESQFNAYHLRCVQD